MLKIFNIWAKGGVTGAERRGDWERGPGTGKPRKWQKTGRTGTENGNKLKNLGIWQKRKTNRKSSRSRRRKNT